MRTLQSDRLKIVPFDLKYLKEYCIGFDADITKYQYPDPFLKESDAQEILQSFIELMNQGEMLFLSILTKDGCFIGSIEVHGLKESQPELGVWIRKEFQRKGYAYEALSNVMKMVDEDFHKEWYVYEADIRNESSIKLVERFCYIREDFEEFTTETGKELKLQRFIVKLK